MLFNVPQYIDIEDRVAGPFTGKQLLWMFGMGGFLLLPWGFLDTMTFIMSAIPIVCVFSALAFYRPNGQPLIRYVFWGFSFIFHPKIYIWRRNFIQISKKEKREEVTQSELSKRKEEKKNILSENIGNFAKTLDTEGKERNEKIMEIIKKNRERTKK